jgi:hypothetical protein
LRNPEYGKRLRELYQLLYADTSKLLFEGQRPISRKQKSDLDLAFATLRAIPSAIALESKFDPLLAAPATARRILESMCDSILRGIAAGTPEPRERKRQRGLAIRSKTSSTLHRL